MANRDQRVMGVVVAIALVVPGCTSKRSAAEKEALRQGVQEEILQQQEKNAARDRAWKDLREQFDKNKDGKLNSSEDAAMQVHLGKIRNGTVVNPFPE